MNASETKPGTPAPEAVREPYEFSPEQNVIVARLASKMQFVGLFALGIAVVAIVAGAFRRDLGIIVSGVLYAIVGIWTERAGRSFRHVVFTKGHDLSHLMHALNDLRKLFTLQYWICFIAIAVTLLLLGATTLG